MGLSGRRLACLFEASDDVSVCLDEGATFVEGAGGVVFLDVAVDIHGSCHTACLVDLDPDGDVVELEVLDVDFIFFLRAVTIFLC